MPYIVDRVMNTFIMCLYACEGDYKISFKSIYTSLAVIINRKEKLENPTHDQTYLQVHLSVPFLFFAAPN